MYLTKNKKKQKASKKNNLKCDIACTCVIEQKKISFYKQATYQKNFCLLRVGILLNSNCIPLEVLPRILL